MSVLSVVKDVCAFVGVHVPTSLFGSVTDARTQLELRAVVNEMAQRIAGDSREWQRLIARQTFTGDGITEAFPLPDNYKRMLVDGNVWRSTSAIQPMMFISSADEWLQRRARGYMHAWGEWMLQGGNMHIWPVMGGSPADFPPVWQNAHFYSATARAYDTSLHFSFEAVIAHTSAATNDFAADRSSRPTLWVEVANPGPWINARAYSLRDVATDIDGSAWTVAVAHTSAALGTTFAQDRAAHPAYWTPMGTVTATSATFNYLDKNCITLASGGFGDTFMSDGDSFRLDERLLRLGMIWQWKALKGSPYAEDMATFMDALTRASGADKPAPTLIHRSPLSTSVAYPYPTPSASDWGWPLS